MDRSKWEYKKLTDVCSILYGYPFDSKCFNETNQGRPLIRIRDVVRGYTETYTTEDCPDDYIINEGDYLVGMDGEFNISSWKSAPALLNQRVCKIAADGANLIDGFMYYLMKTKLKEIEGETAFVTVKHLSAKVLNKVNVNLPSISAQQRIVAELDCLNEMIAVKQEQLKEFDKLAQSIFYDMFGDPVANEKGWETYKLGELGLLARGVSKHRPRNAPELLGGTMPLIQTGDVANAEMYITTYNSTYSDLGVAQSKIWKAGTLCITIAATIGKCAILSFDACFPDSVVGFMAESSKTNNEYMYFIFKRLQKILEMNAPAVAQKNINLAVLNALQLPLPPLTLQQQFADKISAIEAQKELVKQCIAETQALLDYTMDKYFG